MSRVVVDLTMSLDGFVAGPNRTLESPLGEGGERLHEWLFALATFRERHGLSGGETNADTEVFESALASQGAVLMGRRMFNGGEGPWADDPQPDGWWGEEPPFAVPVFVLTHHAREPQSPFTFVTGGIEDALEQARAAAGAKDVLVAGGAEVAQQYLRAGLVDELVVHVAPVLLGDGVSLFGDLPEPLRLEPLDVRSSPAVAHVRYRVASS